MRALYLTAVLAGVVMLGGLGMGCDDQLSCKTAMRNWYSAGCLLVVYGAETIQLDQGEAQDWCESAESRALECGCEDLHVEMIDCMFMVGTAACYDCDEQLTVFQECINTCVP